MNKVFKDVLQTLLNKNIPCYINIILIICLCKKRNFISKPKGPEIGKQERKISIQEDGLSIRLSSTIDVLDLKIFI